MTALAQIRRQPALAAFTTVCLLCLAGAGVAQDLASNWEILGTFTVTMDDEETELYAVRDTETGNATLSRQSENGAELIQITGVTPNDDGQPGVPILTVTLGPYVGKNPFGISVDLREADRVLMANRTIETEAVLNSVALDDAGNLSFAFAAELSVMTPLADGGFETAAGAVPASISGTFVGRVPRQ